MSEHRESKICSPTQIQHVQNATYQSADIQNALISVADSLVKESVICRIKYAKFWSIIADETTDRQNREQLVVVVRYVQKDSNGKWFCVEDPVAVVDVYSLIKGAMPAGGSEFAFVAFQSVKHYFRS